MTEDVAVEYIELGLLLGRHIDGLVDAYYGPPEIKERTDGEDLREPSTLVADAAALLEGLADSGLGETRRRWLEAQIVGLETVARRLAGEEIPFEDEVERCYGVRPTRVPEAEFEAAHRELDDVLPGPGTLAERYLAWREDDSVPPDRLGAVIDQIAADARSRTAAMVGLPEGESIQFDYVSDEPWAAFNYYLGDLRSRIAVNTDAELPPARAVELVVHEAYPGHHSEHAWKEQKLVRENGQLEEAIVMIGTPQSLISEGIAGLAAEMAFGDEEQEATAAFVAGTGVHYDPDVSRAVQRAPEPLLKVGGNIALMIHVDGASVEQAQEYCVRWALASEKRAAHVVQFIVDPVWRSYATTYEDGYQLCRAYVDGEPERFKQLLTEQLTPRDLR